MLKQNNKLFSAISANPKLIFLIDGCGAALTGILLITLVRNLEFYFGMSRNVVNILASIAMILSIFSLLCYQFSAILFRRFLISIICANIIYCIITLSLIIYLNIPIFGLIYFSGEILIILSLVFLELKTLEKLRKTNKL